MSEGLIDPSAVPIPKVNAEALREAAKNLKGDGDDISQAGNDIKSSWQGLDGIYIAPELPTLLAAINPVATKGDDFDGGVTTAGDALIAFADDAERIKKKLEGLKADAQTFVNDVEGDDDWREDEDKVNEHNGLNNDILAALHEYQAAERTCANKITALFGGTTFVAADPGGGQPGAGEKAYGTKEALHDVKTPWATPQEYDAPWWEDVYNGGKDAVVGAVEGLGSMVGLYDGENWGVSSWSDWGSTLGDNWMGTLEGLGSLVGFYGKDGWGVSSFGEWAGNAGNAWKEFAHAIVPWREWGDRPGYVITQSVINIGSMFLGGSGVVKALEKGTRKISGGDGSDGSSNNGDSDTQPSEGQLNQLQQIGNRPGGQTTQDLQNQLDDLDLNQQQLDGLQNALDDSQDLENRATPVGGGNDPVNVDPAFNNGQHSPQYQHSGGGSDPGGGGFDGGGDSSGRGGGFDGNGGHDGSGQQNNGGQDNGGDPVDPNRPDSTDPTRPGDTDPDRPESTDPDRPDGTDPDRPGETPEGDTDSPSTEHPGDTDGLPDGDSDPGDPVDVDPVDNDGSDGVPDGDATPDGDADPDGDGTPDGDADPDGDGTPDGDSDVDPNDPSTWPGDVGEDGVRRFDTDEAGEQYGEEVLRPETYDNLSSDQRYALEEYTRQSWLNPILRGQQSIPDFLFRRYHSDPGPGWPLMEMVGGDSRVTMADVEHAVHRTDLTDEQRGIVHNIMTAENPQQRLDQWVGASGGRGRLIQSFDGFPTEADVRNRIETGDSAFENSTLPEDVEVVRGLHDFSFMKGFDPNSPNAYEALKKMVGETQVEHAYMSTSVGKGPTVVDNRPFEFKFHLSVPEGSHGVWMGKNSVYPDQRELILPRGTRYVITGVERLDDGSIKVNADVLPPDDK